MGYGEASTKDMYDNFKYQLKESFRDLGVKVTYAPFSESTVATGRLGSVKSVAAKDTARDVIGYPIFQPSENIRRSIGIQDAIDAIVYLQKLDFPDGVNVKDSFHINGKQFVPKNTKPDALFRMNVELEIEASIIAVALVCK